MNIVRSLDVEQWRAFVYQHPKGNIFHTPEMFQVYSRTKNFKPELWCAVNNKKVLVLFLPVRVSLNDRSLLRYFTTRSIVYGSILYQPDSIGEEALDNLLQAYTIEVKRSLLFTELRNLANQKAIQPILKKYGFVYEDHLNYLIDLDRQPEEILQSIGRRTRKQIRHGLRMKKISVEEIAERRKIADCYKLLKRSYGIAQVPIADSSLFISAFDMLYPKKMIKFTIAQTEQTPVAASVELLYKGVMYGWYGGVDRNYSSLQPNELLMWYLLKWGAERGYQVYDFGGAGKPDEGYGVRDFKAKFGGQLVCYGRNICIHAPLSLRLSQLGYMVYRRFI